MRIVDALHETYVVECRECPGYRESSATMAGASMLASVHRSRNGHQHVTIREPARGDR
jgi:hypothetical protein